MPPRSGSGDLRLCEELGLLFGRTRKVVYARLSRALESQGESLLDYQLLACLVREGPITQRDIAALAALHPAGVSRLLDDLESRHLVRRKRDRRDRRKIRVEATAEGKARAEARRESALMALDDALRGLNRADRVALRELLEKLLTIEEDERPAVER